MGEGAPAKRNAAAGVARRTERSRFGADVFGLEVAREFVDPADLQVAAEDQPHPFSLVRHDNKLTILQRIAKGEGAAHPNPLALGGGNLVADTLGGDLALELGKGQPSTSSC